MTTPTGPADPGQARPPADDVPAGEVDVRYLAGQRLPADGAWLWITTAGAEPEGEFTAVFLPTPGPHPHGGDVLLHVSPALLDHDADLGGPVQVAPQTASPVAGGFPFLESKLPVTP